MNGVAHIVEVVMRRVDTHAQFNIINSIPHNESNNKY